MKQTLKAEFIGRLYLEIDDWSGINKLIKALKLIPKIIVEDINKQDFINIPGYGVKTWMTFENCKTTLDL